MCDGHWSSPVQAPLPQGLPPSHSSQGTELPAPPDLTRFGVGKSPSAAAQGVGLGPEPTFRELEPEGVSPPGTVHVAFD